MASQITATLPTLNFPKEVDYPTQEDWAAFSAAAEVNFGILGGSWSTQMQLWKNQANAMSTELNNSANIAQSTVNYKGDWISQGYALNESVSVSGIYYICKLTHTTGQNPTNMGSLYWSLALGNWNLKVNTDMSGYIAKTTPIDADLIPLSDSASTFGIKKLSWANLKATLKTYFDTLYFALTESQTVDGIKTFTSSPIVPAPTTATQVANKSYVDTVSPTWTSNDSRAKTALNATGTAPIYACRAWVNFNGTGTVAIRASGNVSSITDGGVGDYTINFTTAMPDANYSAAGMTAIVSIAADPIVLATTSYKYQNVDAAGAGLDQPSATLIFVR